MSGNLMSLGNAIFRPLIKNTQKTMSTITMLIRNVHGTLPPHGDIQRLYRLCTYPVVIGGGHSARHMGQSACATSNIILDFFSRARNFWHVIWPISLEHIPQREKYPGIIFMKKYSGYNSWEVVPGQIFRTIKPGCMARSIIIWGYVAENNFGHMSRTIPWINSYGHNFWTYFADNPVDKFLWT